MENNFIDAAEAVTLKALLGVNYSKYLVFYYK